MALDKRIDQLAATIPVLSDLLAIYDQSNPGTKKVTVAQLASLIGASSAPTTLYIEATAGTSISDSALDGRVLLLAMRGGIAVKVITSGTPSGNDLKFTSVGGTVESASDNPFFDNELIILQYV